MTEGQGTILATALCDRVRPCDQHVVQHQKGRGKPANRLPRWRSPNWGTWTNATSILQSA